MSVIRFQQQIYFAVNRYFDIEMSMILKTDIVISIKIWIYYVMENMLK